MPQSLVRKIIWAGGAAIVLAVLLLVGLPMLASTQLVRDRIAFQLSAWTGYRVEFGQAPAIELWPFRAILTDVSFSDWQDEAHAPVIEAERIEVGLSALAALSGNAVLSGASLLRPIVHVTPSGNLLYAPQLPAGGRIANAIATARQALDVNAGGASDADLPGDALGTVEFIDGQVVVNRASGDLPVMTSIAGTFRWPALNRGAALRATGIWRGESVAIDGTLGRPLMLFAGGASPLSITLQSTPTNASFDGTVSFAANSFVDGKISVSSPSLRRMLEWSAREIVADSATGAFSLSGHAIGDFGRMKLEDAAISMGGSAGSGVLDLSFAEADPLVSGTLAFQTLDLGSLLFAFTPLSPGTADEPVKIDPSSVDRLNLDLRLSATRGVAGGFAMADVAANLQVKGDLTAFDIADATMFDASVQAGVRYDRKQDGGLLDLSLHATDVEAGLVAAAAKFSGFVPTGRATVSAKLKGAAPNWSAFVENATGSVGFSFGPGQVSGLDLTAFMARVSQGGFFPLRDIGGGTLAIEQADFKASVGSRIMRLEKAQLKTADYVVELTGMVPHVGRGLALMGTVLPRTEETPAPEAQFFVGGSWDAPFVSPAFSPAAGAVVE
jgi:AsmA protein